MQTCRWNGFITIKLLLYKYAFTCSSLHAQNLPALPPSSPASARSLRSGAMRPKGITARVSTNPSAVTQPLTPLVLLDSRHLWRQASKELGVGAVDRRVGDEADEQLAEPSRVPFELRVEVSRVERLPISADISTIR